jgi:hypothetical protein
MGGVVSNVKVKNVGNYILKSMNDNMKIYIVQQLAEENQDIYLPEVNNIAPNQSIVVYNETPKSLNLRLSETINSLWIDRSGEIITPTGLSVLSNQGVLLNFLTMQLSTLGGRTSNGRRKIHLHYIVDAFSIKSGGLEPVE